MAETEAAGLYVHSPFCSAICPYCDFAVARGRAADRGRFTEALLQEIELRGSGGPEGGWAGEAACCGARRFDTVYFGGGTPSALSLEQLGAIRRRLAATFEIDPAAEWTIEVNPEDASPESLAGWRELGFDRISLGLQALDDRALRFLGRRHSAEDARASVERAREAGFLSVSVDLIYSLPGFDGDWWLRTVDEAASLGPDHLSCYELTIHDGTPFGRRRDAGRLRETGGKRAGRELRRDAPPPGGTRVSGIRGLELCAEAGGPESAQPEVLAARALPGPRTGRALVRRAAPLGGTWRGGSAGPMRSRAALRR